LAKRVQARWLLVPWPSVPQVSESGAALARATRSATDLMPVFGFTSNSGQP